MATTGVRYGYEPGCFRLPGGRGSDAGLLDVSRALGLALETVEDGNGGAPGSLALNGLPAYERVARILALASHPRDRNEPDRRPATVVSPCTACFRNLSRARQALLTHSDLRRQVAASLADGGLRCDPGSVRVRHLLDVLGEDVGPDAIRARVARPLAGLRVAAYYGCLDTKDELPQATGAPKRETRFERLLAALGAEVVDFPLRSHCCGGRASEASAEVAASLVGRILRAAAELDVACVAVACPRCRHNLCAVRDALPPDVAVAPPVPVRYFTELMADAFGAGA